MGVSNVNNQNKINAIKLNLGAQAKKASANKPAYMQMTGSIFDAPGAKNSSSTATASSLNELNTTRSLNELNGSKGTSTTNKSEGSGSSLDNITQIDNVADGKAAAASAESSADEVEGLTKDTQNDQKTVEKYDSDAQKLDKQITKDDKKFQTKLKKQESELKKDNDKLQKLVKETEETQKEVENAQNELDSLLGSASFSTGKSDGASNPNQDRINELSTFIGGKVSLMQANGQQIYSLQRSSSKTIKQMNKTNANYVKVNQQNQKAITQNQSSTSKVIDVATKIEQISSLVSQTGQAVNIAGKGLVALGSAMSWAAGAGAALIATGNVMQKVGTVVEMVGNYGQMAANVTKTAAYAAEGNLAGALTSAAGAIQTGAAAVKSTKNLGKTFDSINSQANQATQKLASNAAAKDAVAGMQDNAVQELAKEKGVDVSELTKDEIKNAKNEALGGMSQKEMRKSVSAQLQGQMADGSLNAKDVLSDLKKGELSSNNFNAVNNAVDKSKTAFSSAVTEAGGSIKDGVVGGLDKKTRKAVGKQTVSGFTNTATNTVKSSKKFDWGKLANGLQSTAALFASQNTQQSTGATTTKQAPPQWDLSKDAYFQKIARGNRAYVSHASYV